MDVCTEKFKILGCIKAVIKDDSVYFGPLAVCKPEEGD